MAYDALGKESWPPVVPPSIPYSPPSPSEERANYKPTTYEWSPIGCGNASYTAFIQVGLGGSLLRPNPFIDDGNGINLSDSPNYPPLYPNGGGNATISPPGDNNAFADTASTVWGLSNFGLTGQIFEVCKVCLKPCAGVCNNWRHQRYDGYTIKNIGPCRTYTVTGLGGRVDLDEPGTSIATDHPSDAFIQTVAERYPRFLTGDCLKR